MGNAAPDPKGAEFLDAYKGWIYACVNAIAEEVAGIDRRLMRRTRDGWTDFEQGSAAAEMVIQPLNTANPLTSTDEVDTHVIICLRGIVASTRRRR